MRVLDNFEPKDFKSNSLLESFWSLTLKLSKKNLFSKWNVYWNYKKYYIYLQ